MGIFSRKSKVTEKNFELPTLPHEHVWKDLPWYMECHYSGKDMTADYKIVEPYICVTCGKRKDVCLERESWQNIDAKTRDEWYSKIRRRYKKYLKPRAVVEDMINNIILVKDANRLNMLERMQGLPHQNVGTSAEQQQVKETEFKINLPPRDYGDIKR